MPGSRWTFLWIAANIYIHFGWEFSLLFPGQFAYKSERGYSNPLTMTFDSYGNYDTRYKLVPATSYGSNIDKVVLAVEVPAGLIDGPLVLLWFYAILKDKWYRFPVQLTVSALHAFGTIVFWGDELFEGYMSWMTGGGWTFRHTQGPQDFGFWWAFVGTNAVWVIVPAIYIAQALQEMKPALQAEGGKKRN